MTWIRPGVPVGLHPARHVDGVAPEVVQEPLPSDHAGDYGPGVDPDPELEAEVTDRVLRSHRLAHVDGHQRHHAGVVGRGAGTPAAAM